MSDFTIYHGDCLDILQTLAGGSVDAVIADPPYGINYNPNYKKWNGEKSQWKKIEGDNKKFNPAPFLNYPIQVMFGANYYSDLLPVGGWLVWDKRTRDKLDKMFGNPIELIWNNLGVVAIARIQHGGVVNADSYIGNNAPRVHPTQKPIALMEWIIEKLTLSGDTILDPFMGSGTTGVACMRTGRNFIGIELDAEYYAIAETRIKNAAGEFVLTEKERATGQMALWGAE